MKAIKAIASFALAAGLATGAQAANVNVTGNIATSTTWTADNVYNLGLEQHYVLPGATLTIEPGTVIKTTADTNGSGSLAVCRGAKIYALGTKTAPIIFTSTNDTMNGWHVGCGEWGNVTLMGRALVSRSSYGGIANVQEYDYPLNGSVVPPYGTLGHHVNTKNPDGLNLSPMEGLTADGTGDPKVLFGGADDNDDSGTLQYVSLRYGGRVTGFPNYELNGLSMGGVGRATDINHIEIMNNIDDGIETWGGTVNYKYITVWNIGDDSFDIDEGWRGKAQFLLLVQGYSRAVKQGSGIGDNCFETDGAENSDAQPCTNAVIYNATVIGQPNAQGPNNPLPPFEAGVGGDHGTAWRDNAHIQYRNCIFMDLGEQLIKNDGDDGDGQSGYGYNGTMAFIDMWNKPYSKQYDTSDTTLGGHSSCANYLGLGGAMTPAQLHQLYQSQTNGTMAEISDSVFYNNTNASAYTNYNTIAALGGTGTINNVTAGSSPIKAITRATTGNLGAYDGKIDVYYNIRNVVSLDPRAQNDAATSVATAPADGFFTPVQYRGAFSPDVNWAKGWTAADAYGFYPAANTASDPAGTLALVGTVTSFPTANGKLYTVESSTDGINWAPFAVVTGTGSTVQVSDIAGYVSTKLYRVIAQ